MQPMYSSLLSLLENEERNSRNEYMLFTCHLDFTGTIKCDRFLLQSATKQGRVRLKLNLTTQGK